MKLKRSIDDYESLIAQYGIDVLIENVKLDRILVNPYGGVIKKDKCELITNLTAIINNRNNDNEIFKWNEVIVEAQLINKVYRELYEDLLLQNNTTQNPLEAFLLVTEQFLEYINNLINDEEYKNSEMGLIFPVIEVETSLEDKKNFYMNLHDVLTREINIVLTSLKFYEYPKHKIDVDKIVDDDEIRIAYNHFNNVQINDLINYAVDVWAYGGRKVINKDKEILFDIVNEIDESYFIINERKDSKANKIYLSILQNLREIKENGMEPKIYSKFISEAELLTTYFLMDYLNVDDLKKCTYSLSGYTDDIPVSDLIRAYFVLISICKDKLGNRTEKLNCLRKWAVLIEKQKIEDLFIKNGIDSVYAINIINQLTYKKDIDVFDAPLIEVGQGFLILPSLLINIDVSKLVLSLKSEIMTRGDLFEKEIKKKFRDRGFKCNDLYIKDEEEYQCDLAVVIANELYFIECKAWNEFKNITGYFNMISKMKTAKKQFDCIANKFGENIEFVNEQLGFERNHKFKEVHKIVITLNMLGLFRKIDDTYFIDFSCLIKFLDREKPGVRKYGKNPECIEFKGYKEYEGKITNFKFMSMVRNPANIELTRKNKLLGINSFKFSESVVRIPMYAPKHPATRFTR